MLILAVTASPQAFAKSKYPPIVQETISSLAFSCNGFGSFVQSSNFIRRVDLNNDGFRDYILDTGEIRCTQAASIFTGNSGGSILIFVKLQNGTVEKVFDEFKEEVFLNGKQISLGVRGDQCGIDTSNMSRAEDSGCLRQVDWNPVKKIMEFGKILKVY